MSRRVAFVLKGYPRLSETFITQEIRALERRGLSIEIFSLRRPTDRYVHPIHADIEAPVRYLPEYLYRDLRRVARAWRALRGSPAYRRARHIWLRDLARDLTPNRVRRFGQALVLAHELDPGIEQLHAHFLHTPASVARYASILTDRPWSCSAHAKDVWTIPRWEKAEKLAACAWLTTCSAGTCDHLAQLGPPKRVHLNYHGIDVARFSANPEPSSNRTGGAPYDPVIILSVGRAVTKKGHEVLLEALAGLPEDTHWRLVHIGGGPLQRRLAARAGALGVAGRVTWRGMRPHDDVVAAYRGADMFALASRIAADGDRDGLPNVLVEAQSQGLPCVATTAAAIPELIEDGVNGLLVAPDDVMALRNALARLIVDPQLRQRLGNAGNQIVRERFALERGIAGLARLFGLPDERALADERAAAAGAAR